MQYLSPEIQSLIVLFSQVVFVYFRTVNVKAVANGNLAIAVLSGNAIGITGLLSMAIGINSIIDGQLLPVLTYLLGGAIGTYLAMKRKRIKKLSDFPFKTILFYNHISKTSG